MLSTSGFFLKKLSVYQFVKGNVEKFCQSAQHFDIGLGAPLLPVGVATFYNAKVHSNLFLC